ncbi:MAG TPA: hypothetical protein VGV59_16700 [Pyrinomonadaceae bacterium]|nr:hypothetical protein [Pyrinomonadaceae bacterium]
MSQTRTSTSGAKTVGVTVQAVHIMHELMLTLLLCASKAAR